MYSVTSIQSNFKELAFEAHNSKECCGLQVTLPGTLSRLTSETAFSVLTV